MLRVECIFNDTANLGTWSFRKYHRSTKSHFQVQEGEFAYLAVIQESGAFMVI